ncbi:MAG: hypothetical protein OXC28_17660 [Defluviicoccus sp.]|nr:hypothetical protein [Defluviicoccus sp.]
MTLRTLRSRTQLQLSLEPPVPTAPRSTALVRTLADLLLEALDRDTETANRKETIDELEDHI